MHQSFCEKITNGINWEWSYGKASYIFVTIFIICKARYPLDSRWIPYSVYSHFCSVIFSTFANIANSKQRYQPLLVLICQLFHTNQLEKRYVFDTSDESIPILVDCWFFGVTLGCPPMRWWIDSIRNIYLNLVLTLLHFLFINHVNRSISYIE